MIKNELFKVHLRHRLLLMQKVGCPCRGFCTKSFNSVLSYDDCAVADPAQEEGASIILISFMSGGQRPAYGPWKLQGF